MSTRAIGREAIQIDVARIEAARKVLQPGEVKLHASLGWLNTGLRRYRREQKLSVLPASLLVTFTIVDMVECYGQQWLDHWGTSTSGPFACCHEGVNFVSEPYGFDSGKARALDAFCSAIGGIRWHVSSNTWWNPGHSIRITIHPHAKTST